MSDSGLGFYDPNMRYLTRFLPSASVKFGDQVTTKSKWLLTPQEEHIYSSSRLANQSSLPTNHPTNLTLS